MNLSGLHQQTHQACHFVGLVFPLMVSYDFAVVTFLAAHHSFFIFHYPRPIFHYPILRDHRGFHHFWVDHSKKEVLQLSISFKEPRDLMVVLGLEFLLRQVHLPLVLSSSFLNYFFLVFFNYYWLGLVEFDLALLFALWFQLFLICLNFCCWFIASNRYLSNFFAAEVEFKCFNFCQASLVSDALLPVGPDLGLFLLASNDKLCPRYLRP